jgi:hypothetical protein
MFLPIHTSICGVTPNLLGFFTALLSKAFPELPFLLI